MPTESQVPLHLIVYLPLMGAFINLVGARRLGRSAGVIGCTVVAIAMIFNVSVVLRGGGPEGFPIAPFNPASLAGGDVGVAMLFAIMVFLGFEATALFRA